MAELTIRKYTLVSKTQTNQNMNAEAQTKSDRRLSGGEKLLANFPQPQSTTTPKPKFLPYITKKPTISPNLNLKSTETPHPPPNFARIVTPHKEPTTRLAKPQNAVSPNPNKATILDLPLDIWHLITLSFHQSTLNSLTRTCSSLHNNILPLLYHTIDLNPNSASYTNKPDTNKYLSRSPRYLILKSQYLFIKQILAHPELALHVKTLKWTLGLERHGLLPDRIRGEEVMWNDEELFKVFSLMRCVVRLDIDVSTRSHGILPREVLKEGLFPPAIEIKLGGIMKRKLVHAILHSGTRSELEGNDKGKAKEVEPTQLKSLHLDDVQEEATPSSLTSRQSSIPNSNQRATEPPPGVSRLLASSQPMQHILTPALHSRCRNLHHLSIRAYGMSERGTSDDELWAEWAIFIAQVKPREVLFNCDRLLVQKRTGSGLNAVRGRASVANDRRFGETLLPVLREGGEGLRRVVVRGVGESVVCVLEELEERRGGVEVVSDRHTEEGYGKCGTMQERYLR